MKIVAQTLNEGDCTCCETQVISSDSLVTISPSAQEWSDLQNNNNNEYYLSLADGSYNNNNKNNNYWVVPVESNKVYELVFEAEEDCWSNKHSSWDAAKYHYHAGVRILQLIKTLENRTYKPWKSYCFVTMYPKPREIFAAHYQDRIVHHIVAPYMIEVAEAVHKKNGDVSFGNRRGMSSFHACLRIQELMKEHRNGYVASFDLSGYFMSIDREIAWDIFCKFEKEHRPIGYSEEERNFIMWLAEILIKHDPSLNCEKRSPQRLWDEHIKPNKTMFNKNGIGIPIGNYYSQIIANLILEIVCEVLLEYNPTEFVDDFCTVVDTIEEVNEAKHKMDLILSKLKLSRNEKKFYVQPVRHGILWCGYFIYPDRIYISNRTIRNCEKKVQKALNSEPSLESAIKLQQTLNSYFGMMKRASEYRTQSRISSIIAKSKYSEWLYFIHHINGSVVCKLKNKYKKINISETDLIEINNYYKKAM